MSKPRKLISQYHPALYFAAVWSRRIKRMIEWRINNQRYSAFRSNENLPFRIKKHQSVLLKKLGESDLQLQINKITNLRIAIKNLDGIIIRPGETFSFCKLVGFPSKNKGYLPGMELSFGIARAGIGGGLCQISNLVHWLVIHSPLTVIERYHHSFDPFPDDGRVLPFGSGATVFYNYRDYQFRNDTEHSFQLRLWLSEKCLEADLRCDKDFDFVFHVIEKDHAFIKRGDQFFRRNEIWREKCMKYQSGRVVQTELITKNFARVTYTPETYITELSGTS
jgi:vancomycin resistance protein VanW